ncbi:hypothetical protein MBLNU457_4222t1 [Dothideomycetes sp. NU457]
MPGRTRPIEKFGKAVSACSAEVGTISTPHIRTDADISIYQGAAYGKCVVAEYQNVQKGMCAQEFMRLKDCYLAAAKKG